jgi:hypothetical protein
MTSAGEQIWRGFFLPPADSITQARGGRRRRPASRHSHVQHVALVLRRGTYLYM